MKLIYSLIALFTLIQITYAASVTLAWDTNTDGVTKGYYVYTKQGSTQVSKLDAFLFNSSFTVPNLTNSTTYNFYVTAYDVNKKEGLPSTTVWATTPASTPVPLVPVVSSAVPTKNGLNWDVDVTWGSVTGATSYSIQVLNSANVVLFTNASTTTTTKFVSLASGQYSFVVKSVNSAGSSANSAAYSIIILTIPTNLRTITVSP